MNFVYRMEQSENDLNTGQFIKKVKAVHVEVDSCLLKLDDDVKCFSFYTRAK